VAVSACWRDAAAATPSPRTPHVCGNGFSSIQQPGKGCGRALVGVDACSAEHCPAAVRLFAWRTARCCWSQETQIGAPHGCCWSCLLRAVLQRVWFGLVPQPVSALCFILGAFSVPRPSFDCAPCCPPCPRFVMQPLTTIRSALL
jgi:hypothetical protein